MLAKTSGDVLYEFRAETLLKPLYAHFQCGRSIARLLTSTVLYPLKSPLCGSLMLAGYGRAMGLPQKAYQVMVSKKTSDQGFFSIS